MEAQWIVYTLISLGALIGLWRAFGTVASVTPSTKDDEFFAKVDPIVGQVVDAVETVTGKDVDGDGTVGKG